MTNRYRNAFRIAVLLPCLVLLSGCVNNFSSEENNYRNGVYRGVFIDRDVIQVNVEFTLVDGIVKDAKFRHLRQDDDYRLGTEEEPYKSVIAQYQQALDYLVGKDLMKHLDDLYLPHTIITLEVDGYSAATLRTNKIISAIRDGLNRGVYTPIHTI